MMPATLEELARRIAACQQCEALPGGGLDLCGAHSRQREVVQYGV